MVNSPEVFREDFRTNALTVVLAVWCPAHIGGREDTEALPVRELIGPVPVAQLVTLQAVVASRLVNAID
jgi:hypothetical protein